LGVRTHTFEDGNGPNYNLLLEYAAGGTLEDLIKKDSGLCEWDIRRYVRMILQGLCSLHEKGMVHCDLKPSNILVFPGEGGVNDDRLKIADFGLVKEGRDYNEEMGFLRFNFRGTPFYMSPESVAHGEIGAPLDIWLLGCILVEMVNGKPALWKYRNLTALKLRLAVDQQSPGIPEGLSEDGKDFLRKCFAIDPSERWTAEMLLNHPFVSKPVYGTTPDPPVSPKSPWDFSSSSLYHSLGLPPPGWCSFMPSDQNSEQSQAPSASLPPPGWCSFTPSDQNFEQSQAPSASLPPPGWCSFTPSDQNSEQSQAPSASLPPPGWCSFTPSDQNSEQSQAPSPSLPPPGWCSFTPSDQNSEQSLDPSASLPPPGLCSFSSTDSASSACGSPQLYRFGGISAVMYFLGMAEESKYFVG
jgi:serine/threonine protein kinase